MFAQESTIIIIQTIFLFWGVRFVVIDFGTEFQNSTDKQLFVNYNLLLL